MISVSLSDLKAKRAAMTMPSAMYANDEGRVYVNDDGISYTVANVRSTTRATGIVATHNAADCLIEIAEAALAWRNQREDNLMAALARTDAEIEAEAQDVSRARVKRTAELASALERALAKITP